MLQWLCNNKSNRNNSDSHIWKSRKLVSENSKKWRCSTSRSWTLHTSYYDVIIFVIMWNMNTGHTIAGYTGEAKNPCAARITHNSARQMQWRAHRLQAGKFLEHIKSINTCQEWRACHFFNYQRKDGSRIEKHIQCHKATLFALISPKQYRKDL